MGERRRGGQRQAQEGAGGPASARTRGAEGFSAPEGSALQGCAARTSASAGAGGASRSPSLSLRPGGRRRSAAWAAEGRGLRAEAAAAAQRPDASRVALATVWISTRRGRELASITADLPQPPCWEETTRHAAAERLQRRKRRQRQALPAQSGRGAGRQGAEGGGRSGPSRSALRRPGGASRPPAFACRAAWGVAGVLRRCARLPAPWAAPLRGRRLPYPRSCQGAGLPDTMPPLLLLSGDPVGGSAVPSAPGVTETPTSPILSRTVSTCSWTRHILLPGARNCSARTVPSDYLWEHSLLGRVN